MSSLYKKNYLIATFICGLIVSMFIPKVSLDYFGLFCCVLAIASMIGSVMIETITCVDLDKKGILFLIANALTPIFLLIPMAWYHLYRCHLSLSDCIKGYTIGYPIAYLIIRLATVIIINLVYLLFTFNPDNIKNWIVSKKKGNVYNLTKEK